MPAFRPAATLSPSGPAADHAHPDDGRPDPLHDGDDGPGIGVQEPGIVGGGRWTASRRRFPAPGRADQLERSHASEYTLLVQPFFPPGADRQAGRRGPTGGW
jgi:hypothetical protein